MRPPIETQVIFDTLRESLKRIKADSTEVAVLVDTMQRDLNALNEDLAKQPSKKVHDWIVEEIEEIVKSRKIHILAAVEAKAGIEAKAIADTALDIALTILVKLVKII